MIVKCNSIKINTNIDHLFCDWENTLNECVLYLELQYFENLDYNNYLEKICYKEGFEYIFISNNVIYTNTQNIEYIETSLFSTPLSIVAIMNNLFLLHCSSIYFNDQIVSFSGQSGSGKTTILMRLINKFNVNIYSDDSILLENTKSNVICHQVLPLIKLTNNTASKCNIKINQHKIYKKTILKHSFVNGQKALNCIFIIKRSNNFSISQIISPLSKSISLANLIVGKDYISPSIIDKSFELRNNISQKINIYTLSINSFNDEHLNSLYNFIKEIVKNDQ